VTRPVVQEIADMFIDDAVDVVLADCKKYKSFTSLHGVRALPAFHLYPENIRAPFPFQLQYNDTKTALDYADEIRSTRLLSSDVFGDLGPAAAAVAAEFKSTEQRLQARALERQKERQAQFEAIELERKVRKSNRTYIAALEGHAKNMAACQAGEQADSPPVALEGVNCSSPAPPKPPTLVKAEELMANRTTAANQTMTMTANVLAGDQEQQPPSNATAQGNAESVEQEVIEPNFAVALELAAATKADLRQRIQRIEFLEKFLQEEGGLGSGGVLRALNVRAADLYNSVVEQFVDKKRRGEVLMEMSVLYPIADALAAQAAAAVEAPGAASTSN